jgi:hypothetical protein
MRSAASQDEVPFAKGGAFVPFLEKVMSALTVEMNFSMLLP